ncbi:MAG: putative septation protein SpoVG [bacterium ADurb.Bin431]|nr:MAG: putative septation protein SpoVG [bacterium ADurb.Bin431]HNY91869.1 SpoVG family protein [bacterium]HOC24440.1 SpoVG family protein [bacterium]HOH06093.1 SpoVG family protein [bacterium]HOY44942.1 SpoVG family protein [bacterium]
MEITEISIRLRNESKLKAFVNVTFDNQFAVKGLKIIQSKKGVLLCMPSRKSEDGMQRDIAHPITKEFRTKLEQEILAEYARVEKRAERGEIIFDNSKNEEWAYVDDEI